MEQRAECEACMASVHLTDSEIKALFGETLRVKNVKTVSEETYARRMDECGRCERLLFGTTCPFCGCIVQIKAKLQNAKCPYPYAPRW